MAARLERAGHPTELVVRTTQGDAIVDRPFKAMEGKGFFTKELEEALLAGEADLAVHSLKDLPTELPAGLALAATPEREDPADLLLVRRDRLDARFPLPVAPGARIGTTSTRRRAQWLARRPDTELWDLRGNVPTRVEKLRAGKYDAILLASAGLRRLGLDLAEFHAVRLDPAVFVCAPGQGALGLETRDEDRWRSTLAPFDDAAVREAVAAERGVLAALGGGCSQPVGAHGRRQGARVVLHAVLGPEIEGSAPLRRARAESDRWETAVAEAVARLRDPRSAIEPWLRGRTVAVTQRAGRGEALARDLEERGARVLAMPLVEVRPRIGDAEAAALRRLSSFDYVVITSRAAAEILVEAAGREAAGQPGPRFVAMGSATAEPLSEAGIEAAIVGEGAGGAALAAEVAADARARGVAAPRALFPSAREARPELQSSLEGAGFTVERVAIYETVPVPEASLAPFRGERADFAVFFSPSAARAFAERRPIAVGAAVAAGETTRRALAAAGFPGARAARSPAAVDLLEVLR